MDNIFRGPLPGGGYVIACGRRRRVRCATCAAPDAQLECDGCDKALCSACSVSPRKGLDFCPRCFDPAWKRWLQARPSSIGHETRAQRRAAFRAWARATCEVFLSLVPLSALGKAEEKSRQALAAGKTPHALWLEAGGDGEKYRALMVEHGHLVKKEE